LAVAVRLDPLPAFNFVVQLLDERGVLRSVASFTECTGLESTLEVEEYQEGGLNDRVHKLPSRFSFSNITLRRGVTLDPQLRIWHQSLLKGNTERRNGLIVVFSEAQLPIVAWRFERALPVRWIGPTLNATQSDASIETLEIAIERLEPWLPGAPL
jgi:phage tail-like protein